MDAYINPFTADYVVTNGAPVRAPMAGLANAVYLRLMTPLGSYWADPTLGSRLHELTREKDLARIAVLTKQYAETALTPLIVDGRATRILVSVERYKDASSAGRQQLSIEVDAASGERQTFHFPIKVI
ncbi:MAG: phage GP46 family protein [Undibacterium sp.]|uniref:phage GP46 family protein n=1 Tax=Undibacterium sp. TaxID=1914977 RepID=UPI0027195FA1|nr:phage GP46 family protein [Undibacterium sp.]MDO8654183.1 phage GP46 family protein [Undibacterium sp.]